MSKGRYDETFAGEDVTKPVFGVFDKASFKPVSSATEISRKVEVSPVASLHMIRKVNNKGADQTARMRRLVCACVVCKPLKTGFLASKGPYVIVPMFFYNNYDYILYCSLLTRFRYSGKARTLWSHSTCKCVVSICGVPGSMWTHLKVPGIP